MKLRKIIDDFFRSDSLQILAQDAGRLLDCPLMIVDNAFRVQASHQPPGFEDPVFRGALERGQITYENMSVISQDPALTQGRSITLPLADTPFPRRFSPLVSSGIRVGYLTCVDWHGTLDQVPEKPMAMLESILAKQLLSESSRNSILSSTAEEILARLLDGKFASESIFRLQIASSYLAGYHPRRLGLIDLSQYHSQGFGQDALKKELQYAFYASHPFFYQNQVLFFLTQDHDTALLQPLTQRFSLPLVVSAPLDNLYGLPKAYRLARQVMDYLLAHRGGCFAVEAEQLYPALLLERLQPAADLCSPAVLALAQHDRHHHTQYCATLYVYLSCHHSLQQTCARLFLHRNTALYRIRKIRDTFGVPLDDPSQTLYLLLSAALSLPSTGQEELLSAAPI